MYNIGVLFLELGIAAIFVLTIGKLLAFFIPTLGIVAYMISLGLVMAYYMRES